MNLHNFETWATKQRLLLWRQKHVSWERRTRLGSLTTWCWYLCDTKPARRMGGVTQSLPLIGTSKPLQLVNLTPLVNFSHQPVLWKPFRHKFIDRSFFFSANQKRENGKCFLPIHVWVSLVLELCVCVSISLTVSIWLSVSVCVFVRRCGERGPCAQNNSCRDNQVHTHVCLLPVSFEDSGPVPSLEERDTHSTSIFPLSAMNKEKLQSKTVYYGEE